MHRKLTHLLCGRKSGIMHENLYSNVVYHLLSIVDYKLQSQYTPKRSHNHVFVKRALHEEQLRTGRKRKSKKIVHLIGY